MISTNIKKLIHNNSAIREMFEEGNRLKKIYGEENVFDFSLGNPCAEVPQEINDAIINLVKSQDSVSLHGYMNNSGYPHVRQKIADKLNRDFNADLTLNNIVMTCGAASGLNIVLKTLLNKDDEVLVIAPYFVDYGNYVDNYLGKLVVVKAKEEDFLPDLIELEKNITKKTKALIINTPNNPTGVIYGKETIEKLSKLLEAKEKEYHNDIYLISDEPYREIVYDNHQIIYIPKYYHNTIIVYSYSKSLSLPGERIGYVAVSNKVSSSQDILAGLGISNRILGNINAPSLIQNVLGCCPDSQVDLTIYQKNRDLLYKGLTKSGFHCPKPEGAFYLFVKVVGGDDQKFCQFAKKYNLLMVPGSAFAYSGYVRISYCVPHDVIKRALPVFEQLSKDWIQYLNKK